MPAAFAISRPGGAVELVAPYQREFIDALKSEIPASYRTYDPGPRTWSVESLYATRALGLARRFYDHVEALSTGSVQPRPAHSVYDCLAAVRSNYPDYARLGVLPGARPEVMQGAYRAQVRLNHPDLVGSSGHAATVALNLSYARLSGSGR